MEGTQSSIEWGGHEERHARDQGKARAASAHREALERARSYAYSLASSAADKCTTSDAVRQAMKKDRPEIAWGNWAGSIFADRETWEDIGVRRSEHPGGHRRKITLWRLK